MAAVLWCYRENVISSKEARKLQKRGLLLGEDVQRCIDAAEASDVLK